MEELFITPAYPKIHLPLYLALLSYTGTSFLLSRGETEGSKVMNILFILSPNRKELSSSFLKNTSCDSFSCKKEKPFS